MTLKILKWLGFKDKRYNYTLTDEDRDRALEIRKEKHELAKLEFEMQRKRLELEQKKMDLDFKAEYGNDNNIQEIMIPVLQILQSMKTGANSSTTPPISKAPVLPSNLTDEDIREFIKAQNPTYIALAKKAPKSEVLAGVMQKFKLDERQANKAYDILITEF